MAGGGSDRLVCVARSAAVRKAEKQEEAKCLIQDIHQVLGRRNDCSHLGGRCGSGESACRREMNERKGSALTAEAAFHTNFRLLGIFFLFNSPHSLCCGRTPLLAFLLPPAAVNGFNLRK